MTVSGAAAESRTMRPRRSQESSWQYRASSGVGPLGLKRLGFGCDQCAVWRETGNDRVRFQHARLKAQRAATDHVIVVEVPFLVAHDQLTMQTEEVRFESSVGLCFQHIA